jgi:hypothetical protein|tara:strand:- start:1225 stop:1479 length:255 start_codon:yes stop_codon:yes gene_type:complete
METEISPIQLVLALPSLVCLIIVIVNMFQNGKTGLGIATIILTFLCGIGSLIAFIWGWMNVGGKVMIAWTILTVAGIIASVGGL